MNVEYSGWREDLGFFRYLIALDEKREDYEIHRKNGRVGRQVTPFEELTYDWNNDGDIYPLFGAFFQWDNGRDFLTPVDMVSLVLEGEARIPGIENPLEKPSLNETLHQAQQRKASDAPSPEKPPHQR